MAAGLMEDMAPDEVNQSDLSNGTVMIWTNRSQNQWAKASLILLHSDTTVAIVSWDQGSMVAISHLLQRAMVFFWGPLPSTERGKMGKVPQSR